MFHRSCLLLVVLAGAAWAANETTDDHRKNFKGYLPLYYSDAFARYLYWPLCEIPYDNATDAAACLNRCFYDSELLITDTVSCGIGEYLDLDPCTGSIIVAHDYKAIIISFEGGDGAHQVPYIVNISALWEPIADPLLPIGKVNFYYINGFKLLFVNQTLERVFNGAINRYPDYTIFVVGHSLGGAFSTIASAYIRLNYPKITASRIHAASFGALIVGDAEFAKNFAKLVPHNQRVVHADDPAPRLATDVLINGTDDRAYLHVQGDTWYNNTMTVFSEYNVCPGLYHYGNCTYFYNSMEVVFNWGNASSFTPHLNYFDAVDRCTLCNRTLDLASLPA